MAGEKDVLILLDQMTSGLLSGIRGTEDLRPSSPDDVQYTEIDSKLGIDALSRAKSSDYEPELLIDADDYITVVYKRKPPGSKQEDFLPPYITLDEDITPGIVLSEDEMFKDDDQKFKLPFRCSTPVNFTRRSLINLDFSSSGSDMRKKRRKFANNQTLNETFDSTSSVQR